MKSQYCVHTSHVPFKIQSPFSVAGDQSIAISKIIKGINDNQKFQTLKGVTGSGKTYSMAKIVEKIQRPTLVLSHNKTLAAQLYREFKDFFPNNAIEYFVSYYDYYQPEAYVPGKDLFIEKDASIDDEIKRLRLSATTSLYSRLDVLIVATVACIYGLGNPEAYSSMAIELCVGEEPSLSVLSTKLVNLQYERNDVALEQSRFRIQDDCIDIYPAYEECIYRVIMEWEKIIRIQRLHPITFEIEREQDRLCIFPANHFVTPKDQMDIAIKEIKKELKEYHSFLTKNDNLIEAQRIKSRTEYDLEMLAELGFCTGIENYSMHMSGRKTGERPAVLFDYFPNDFLLFIDESHVSIPQIRAMYAGDRARKENLVKYGFRLPSAKDNRPLTFKEFEEVINNCIFVSATPGPYEIEHSQNIVEQVIRPTGLLDPIILVQKTEGQVEDLINRMKKCILRNERILVTTLTKKMAEHLADYFVELGIKGAYIHSDLGTVERVEILIKLRNGEIDVLVGVNLLREGLDLPEVSLVAIFDADKIGFLRSSTALIQTIGRAARNVNGCVIMYADKETDAMRSAIDETNRRRTIQHNYNQQHGITPTTIKKAVKNILERSIEIKKDAIKHSMEFIKSSYNILVPKERKQLIKKLEDQMNEHAERLEFEEAAVVRDEIQELKKT